MPETSPQASPTRQPDACSDRGASRRRLRFRLSDLLLLTALVAAWLPYYFATRQFATLEAENDSLRQIARILVVDDPTQIHVLQLRSRRSGAFAWQVFVPESSPQELRFATEQISSLGFPPVFDRVPLTPGEHHVSLIQQRSSQGHRYQLFVDQQAVTVHEHPADWIDAQSSSSTSTGSELRRFAVDEPVVLRREWILPKLPGFPRAYGHDRPELSHLGSLVWIASADSDHPPLPLFVTPKNLTAGDWQWGFREGIRIRISRWSNPASRTLRGAIQIVHAGTRLQANSPLNQVTIKPQVVGQRGYGDSTTEPSRQPGGKLGLELMTSNSLSPPESSWQAASGVISADGSELTLFIHPESFANDAQPIIEVRFVSDHPDRVGFRWHTAAGSVALSDCVLSAVQGSFAMLRRLHLVDDQVETVPQSFPRWSTPSQPAGMSAWATYSADQFPFVEGDDLRRVALTSDVADYSQVKYAAATAQDWHYLGLPAQQSWIFPAASPVTVGLRARAVLPNANGPVPGGAAYEECELRRPQQTNTWIWYEVLPLPKASHTAD